MRKRLLILFITLAIIAFVADFGVAQNRRVNRHRKYFKTQTSNNLTEKPKVEIENHDFFAGGRAMNLPQPRYSKKAKAKKISGTVKVEIVVDEQGKVIWAKAISGNKLFQKEAVRVARLAKFAPVEIAGRPVKVGSIVPYVFSFEEDN